MAAADALLAADPGLDVLAEACDAHATANDWVFVSAHADDLLAEIPTPGSLRLLVIAAWNQGEYRRCRDALDEHRHVYQDGRLPQDLALLRVRCQRMLGEFSQAARAARLLFDREPSPDHLAELVNAQLEGGDGVGLLDSLRRLLVIEGANSNLLMQGAQLAAQMDRDLAISLWRNAVSLGSDEKGFPFPAYILGANLGLSDEETGPWLQQMAEQAKAGEGGSWALHISELPRFAREQHKYRQRLLDMYWHGNAPVHRFPDGTLAPLPMLFHGAPERNRADPDPLLQPPILIRHGARPMRQLKPRRDQSYRLILDLTALLTAHSVGLLEFVEKTFAPLWLPRQWHLLLRGEINRLSHSQPRWLTAHDRIAQLVRSRDIRLVDLSAEPTPPDALLSLVGEHQARELVWVGANDGRLLTYLPLHGPDIEKWQEVELPPDWSHLVLGPRALLDGLLAEHLIDTDTHQRAQASFPPEPTQSNVLPAHGGLLLTSTTMLQQFTELDLLAVLSHRFRLCIEQYDWKREEQEANQRERLETLVTWTEALIERVSAGLQTGLYQLLPSSAPPDAEEVSHLKGLDDILVHQGETGDLLWVDDRFLNGYLTSGTTPIIGVVEVLDLLRAFGAVSREERFQFLYLLRASNARFIPLEADEILHWLGKARTESRQLIAPRQLEVLARYWTACLYQGSALKWEGNEHHARGEIPFVLSSQSVVAEVMRKIWSDRRYNPRRRRQRADWVLDNLYVGIGDLAHLIPESGLERDMNLVGMDIGSLFFGAFEMLFHRSREVGRREMERLLTEAEEYLRWVCKHNVAPRLRADRSAVTSGAAAIRSLLLGSFVQTDDDLLSLVGRWMQRFFPIVPDTLRAELHKDQAFMQRLGLKEITVTEIDGKRVAVRDLWPAVESALRGAAPTIDDLDDGKPLTLRLVSKPNVERSKLEVADAKGRLIGRHYFEHSEILSLSRDMRLQALHRNPHWWDGAPYGCDEVERELAGIDSPELRMRQLERLAAASADSHYRALAAQWQHDKRIHIDLSFPPTLDAILIYVRCNDAQPSEEPDPNRHWKALADSMPAERGLAERLRRIALLPVALPESACEELLSLDADRLASTLGELSTVLTDPIGRLHLIDLALSAAAVLPDAIQTAQVQIDYLGAISPSGSVRCVRHPGGRSRLAMECSSCGYAGSRS
jgi:hypothetical protein